MRSVSWEDEARCLRYDPEMFFAPRATAEKKAKAICARCIVRTECLAVALDSRTEFGVWGGMTSGERRSLLRRSPGQPDRREVLASAGLSV